MGESKYSEYYDIRESDATCRTCGKVLQMKRNNTKGLKYHAEKIHNIKFNDDDPNTNQNSIVIMKLENDSDQDKTEEENVVEDQAKKPFKCTELNFLGTECEKR